jgi:hypothetical protein
MWKSGNGTTPFGFRCVIADIFFKVETSSRVLACPIVVLKGDFFFFELLFRLLRFRTFFSVHYE